ncbi:diaminopimelate decarboxylase [Propionicimonas paludicola]|uniref:Diaminopimelate decarboxylase n=1 Tax=Propionicimonas paludicola TaxID=185243 RepID=A0A2A9CTF6_9ACTN|nr:diaminopimelate decarboxylase [Propionicimonas paludicola]PFG16829.1 diaminopimelate decarboxylase [Propionicimonas paludicola]
MTHMHVAGAIHADVASPAPVWLTRPDDVNELTTKLWSSNTKREEDGVISIAGVRVTDLAEQVGTPVYVLDEDDFRTRARTWREAFAGWTVYYASKAFISTVVARWLAEEGLSVDVASLGELTVALRGGVDPARIAHHGNNKSDAELRVSLTSGVGRIVVDSSDEITRLERLCAELGVTAKVMVRVTTGVEAHTHEYIATAHEDQKFGFSIGGGQALVALFRCQNSPHLDLVGVHSHIGSQIFDTNGFEVAARRTLKLFAQFREATGQELPELDLGGGFGIAYTKEDTPSSAADLAAGLREIVRHECAGYGLNVPRLSIEPGRALIGPAGTALYRVGTVKPVELGSGFSRRYLSVDGGMSDNIRPALYAAEYSAALANRVSDAEPVISRVVGVHCEGGDILVRNEFLPGDTGVGDLLAVPASGAYSRAMASNYNHTPRPPVVAVNHGRITTILRRETLDDLLALDAGLEKSES